MPIPPRPWWEDAVAYQVYVRSFRDSNGDGIGDLPGIRAALPELSSLGIDAIWLNPCYTSPQRDHGYDIADYFEIDPAYGTIDDLAHLVEDAHARGIRVLMDMVANHCSDEHAWFRQALAAEPGSAERERFIFRDGRGVDGKQPPNNWQSVFGGSAWTRVFDADGRPGQWYLHSFDRAQPDFNWRNPEVAAYFDQVLTFWFDLGVDGFRIDVAHGHVKSAELADWPGADDGTGGHNHDMWDQPEVHDIYRSWRAIGERQSEPKYFVGEIWVPSVERLSAYLRSDELHQAFNFELLVQPWDGPRLRAAIESGLHTASVGGPQAWTLSNHDVHRTVTRYGQEQELDAPEPTDMIAAARRQGTADLELGTRRARAAAALLLALPGTVYLYQGEELGLPEVFDLPDHARQDPIWLRSGGMELGRDGCRVPLPWSAEEPNFGFTPSASSAPWLPQPEWFGDFAADSQRKDAGSMLRLYSRLIQERRHLFRGSGSISWLDTGDPQLLAFTRGAGACVINLGDEPASIPSEWGLGPSIISTATSVVDGNVVPVDSAAWFAFTPARADAAAHTGPRVGFDSPAPHLHTAAPQRRFIPKEQ
ncbi:glycoside hydrolase family 13 protein [Microbacterium suwonense]|uniref:Alpha-glucosidase n=1 Tax=Microbacterium suwonense TaxID=683047 RepID=A0ABM8FVE0_9MICO|nr:glycoside hydrolase family 13 protein [Microbacterium suwonense]BDZ39487.1 alpha-glucosidase [Microbacterium suwonense]